ncbi:Pentatricopeptide repeat-containing protein 1 [Habropoda laboriosa]|uniref:Pentatricopeptide repeat-containing protein 1 n=2 Tax=Habropoda laboriosa TaxID=597456 RepID=A0A0L7R4C3_9HYME|nr:Pentatricopeptide repeat-containing protein 1 [Habropoda laboriosa]
MDEAEQEEEKIADYINIPKWQRYTSDEYCQLIKSHIINKDLQLALNVLDLMKENREKPTSYMYKLLISAYAKQGDVKQCFTLFRKMKQRGLFTSPSIYTSLINACSETTDTEKALQCLTYIREYLYERKIELNKLHYTTLIKAYSRHKQILTAFEIADEAKDKGICTPGIIAVLFHAAISDKENGLKLTLMLWHKMRATKIKPNILHYNLLLRAIRETKLGDLKVNDILIPELKETQVQLSEVTRPDLLSSPPVLSTSLIPILRKNKSIISNDSNLDDVVEETQFQNLNDILCENRLILFGGIEQILKQMKDNGVEPNIKTYTLLLDLLPSTNEAEKYLLKYIEGNHFQPDLIFFNILIKRRSQRKRYEDAKAVLNLIQMHHFTPNIYTFEALALGCIRHKDGIELLQQMETIGYAPDNTILEKLLFNACYHKHFNYILYLMDYVLKHRIKSTAKILAMLEKFDGLLLEWTTDGGEYNYRKMNAIRKDYNKFKIKFENWKEKLQKYETMIKGPK